MTRIFYKALFIGLLALLGMARANAQYVFAQSFASAATLSKAGWHVASRNGTTTRDTVNGYRQPGEGSVRVSFPGMPNGDVDTLRLPAFAATGFTDSVCFDHAHRAKTRGSDSMAVFYSTDGGITMQRLHSLAGSSAPDSSTLSTMPPGTGSYRPVSAAEWGTKSIALPVGTNALMFVFYSDGGDELYLDNILVGQEPLFCNGAPLLAGMPAIVTACAGTSFYIMPDTFEVNPFISYEWKRSSDNGTTDPWTTVTGAHGINTPELYLTGFSQPYWYRLEATCGSMSFSPSVQVVFDSSYNCYCRGSLGGFCNTWITGVELGSLNNTSNCTGGSNSFTFYPPATGTTDTLTVGDPYASISVSTATIASLRARTGFWIDYNRDGVYDSSEFNMISTNAATGTHSFQFAVPATAVAGLTGLRVRAVESGSFLPAGSFQLLDGRHACTNGTSGETEEYLIYIRPSDACTSTPDAGTFRDTIFTVCQGTSLTFRAEGASFGPGIVYQWEQSADKGVTEPWHDITGADSFFFTTPPMVSTMYYRLKVTCAAAVASAYTPVVEVIVNPFYTCYCATNLGGNRCNASTAYISNVTLAGTTINNTSGCSNNTSSYTAFPVTTGTSDTVYNGQLVRVDVTNVQRAARVAVWIDYDHSGTYDRAEFNLVTASSKAGIPSQGLIEIPAAALNGYTGMRVRIVNAGWPLDSGNACSNLSTGETEDYIINIQPAPLCSGMPVAGTYPVSYSICTGDSIRVASQGATFGNVMVYRWQESPDSLSWTDVITGSGSDSRIFTSAPLTAPVYYRLAVTCANSGFTAYGEPVKVSIKPFYNCYCASGLGAGYSCTSNEYISNVSFPGRNLDVTSTCVTPVADDSYTYNAPAGPATDSVTAGDEVLMSVTYRGSFASRVAVWIDYNHNAIFEKEEYTLVSSYASPGTQVTGVIVLPVSATAGYTGMRVRATNYSAPLDSADACAYIGDGETEDYVLFVRPAVPCDNTVSAGTLPATLLMCPGKDFTLTASGVTVGSGITYTWQESDDNGATDAWAAVSSTGSSRSAHISGIYQSRYFRLKVECSHTSDSVFTNSMQVLIDTFYNCYDANTDLGGGMCSNDYISHVSIDGTTLDNSTLCNNTPKGARSVFPPSGNTTATLVTGATYTVNVTPNFVKSMGVWIDFNRNGVYEASEFKLIHQRSNVQSPVAVSVPANAVPGLTGMRVRTSEPRAVTFPVGGIFANQAAATFTQGETEDYVILIDTLKPASNVTVSDVTASAVTVSWTNGNGEGRVVVAQEDAALTAEPLDAVTYNPDVIYASGNGDSTGAGNYVVYSGNRGNSVTVEGLDSNKTYRFYVYEYTDFPKAYFTPGQQASASTLPVTWLSFRAAAEGADVILNWTTASEKNNRGFEVQRSANGMAFEAIAFVDGKGHSAALSHYSYTDRNAVQQSSVWYYRLKQTDMNGACSYSDVVRVSGGTGRIAVAPNPFDDHLDLHINDTEGSVVTVQVTDLLGHVLIERTEPVGGTGLSIGTKDLAGGVYFVILNTGTQKYCYKVVKPQ